MQELYLGLNEISYLDIECYFGLDVLQKLDLRNNATTFNGLKQLSYLGLANNRLIYLDANSPFAQLVSLVYISLSLNELVSVDRNVFVGLLNLTRVDLDMNPISLKEPAYVLALCSTNPTCFVYI